MDDHFAPRPIAGWYMPAAIASLLFMLLGCATFLMNVTQNPASLPLDQRAMFEAQPVWITAAFGISSIVGAVGALMLVLRRKAAQRLMLLSLLAIMVWLAGLLAAPGFHDLASTRDIALAIAVLLITWTIFWFARHSRQRGWLK
jgi:energy-converting hydrogenase Eha subunit C